MAVAFIWFAAGAAGQPLVKAKLQPKPADIEKILTDADAAEKGGSFEAALEQYLRAFSLGRTDAEVRDRIRTCLRHVARIDRAREPAVQQFVASLSPSDAVALYAEVVEKVHRLYPDRDRATFERLFAAGLDELERAIGDRTFRQTYLPDVPDPQVSKFQAMIRDGWRPKLPTNQREAANQAREVMSAAQRLLGAKAASAVAFELLCGACAGLDEYSAYVPPATPQTGTAELAAYGLIVRFDPRGLLIDGVIAGSWAAVHTKLRKGDLVVAVNGQSVRGVTPTVLVAALRGHGSYGHEFVVAPTEDDPFGSNDLSVRLPVPLPTVYGVQMLSQKDGVAYVRLAAFKDATPREVETALLELKARGMRVLLVDVRGNPGGLLTSVVEVAKLFLPSGLIVSTGGQAAEFANRVFSSDSGMLACPVPVVLLIDAKTMSAAEVLAAALKDNDRATLVGTATFGKGLVQATVPLQSFDGPDGQPGGKSGVLVLSVATLFGPRGAALAGGVTPHVAETDPERQLAVAIQKALELIQGPQPMPMMMK
jgi:C-terminal peptidase prc